MSRLSWRVQRLRAMGPRELTWRVGRAADGLSDRLLGDADRADTRLFGVSNPDWEQLLQRFREGEGRPILLDRACAPVVAAGLPEQVEELVAAAERVLSHRFSPFGLDEVALADPIDWHRDARTGWTWPLVPAHRIDHRTTLADPKWIWELNRLQHLPWLAQAWLFTGEERFAEGALRQLGSWIAQHPVGRGIAWRGAFEVGVRAISVAVALQGLRDAPGLTPHRYRDAVRMLATGARRCWRERSRFSSANNHLIGEMSGLATVAILFPELAGSTAWEQRALQVLAVEAGRQILADGAGAEQSVGYHLFAAELLLVPAALLRLRGDEPPRAITAALERSAGYLAALIGDDDPAPRYGDDDGGFALRLSPAPLPDVRRHLAAVAAMTAHPGAARVGRGDLLAAWLGRAGAGGHSPSAEPGLMQVGAAGQLAPHGGLIVLRARSRRVTMDVGPLGYLALAAHGHADALAVTLAVDGEELIGDPGTGSYYGNPQWRTAFRGTRAHATLSVDDVDQSVAGGAFLWTRHATVTVLAADLDRGVVEAAHDGYARLRSPVTHRRWLLAPPESRTTVVVDLVEGTGQHRMRTTWPLPPELDAVRSGAGHRVTRDGRVVLQLGYAATIPWTSWEVRGDAEAHLGWWSTHFESRTPSWLVGSCCEATAPVALGTLLVPLDDAEPAGPEPAIALAENVIEMSWQEGGVLQTVRLDTSTPGGVTRRVGSRSASERRRE